MSFNEGSIRERQGVLASRTFQGRSVLAPEPDKTPGPGSPASSASILPCAVTGILVLVYYHVLLLAY